MKTKTIIFVITFIIGIMGLNNVYSQENVNNSFVSQETKLITNVAKKQKFPNLTIGIAGGIGFPVASFSDQFKQSTTGAIDIGLRINSEVGIFVNGKYSNLPRQGTESSRDNLIEISAGPRYYFTSPKLKSMFFVEAGLGAYFLNRGTYTTGNVVVDNNNSTNIGANIGPGFSLWLSDRVDIMLKGKYHVIFTKDNTTNFVTSLLGLEYKF